MKKTAYLLLFFVFGCNQNRETEGFIIRGELKGDYTDYIYLNYGTIKDSTKIIDAKFEFKGKVKSPVQGYLTLKPSSNLVGIYIENSDIKIIADFKIKKESNDNINFLTINNIKGSKIAKLQEGYKEFYQQNESKKDFNKLLFKELKRFFKKNPKHPFSAKILGEVALIEPVLNYNEVNELYHLIDTTTQQKDDLEMIKMGLENLYKYGIGKPFLELELQDSSSNKINIKDYLGKVTLVDFWASWCVPCRLKHPELIKLYNEYKDKNFDILSVSIDKDSSSWAKAISKDKLTWNNVLDVNSVIYDELKTAAIPANYLLDENGIIIKRNISSEQIKIILDEKISDKKEL